MDRPQKSWPHVYDFWDLVEQAAAVEVGEEFVADDSSEHISVLRFTGGTTGLAKCAPYTLFKVHPTKAYLVWCRA
jgi:acyl-coenzyme A synthetase/AMP-(fatty) acid ligase